MLEYDKDMNYYYGVPETFDEAQTLRRQRREECEKRRKLRARTTYRGFENIDNLRWANKRGK